MLTSTLALSLLLQGTRSFPASRFLPDDRTLVLAEIASPALVWKHRGKIAQVGFFERERMIATLRWGAAQSPSMQAILANVDVLREVVTTFDRGWTGASVFTEATRGTPQPNLYFVASAGDAKRARGLDAKLARLLGVGKRSDYLHEMLPIADSPVAAHRFRRKPREDRGLAGSWRREASLLFANKGRVASFHHENVWFDPAEEGAGKKALEARLAIVAGLVGLGARTRGGRTLGRSFVPPEGAELIGRFALRFASNAVHPAHGLPERQRERARKAGFLGWKGLQSFLWMDEHGVPHERFEVHYAALEGVDAPVVFSCVRGDERGLGDVAAAIPAFALGAMRVAIDGKRTSDWFHQGLVGLGVDPADVHDTLRWIRVVTGLAPSGEKDPRIDELGEVTLALLPPAAGSLLPELVMAVPVPAHEGQVDTLLEACATGLVESMGGASAPRLRSLGNGDDAIRYVPLKQLFQVGGTVSSVEGRILTSLLGGGFLSAARVGETLYVGFNPRTMRKLVRAVREGETLAGRAGFLQRFPKGSGRAVEGWFDFPRIAQDVRLMTILLPMLFVGRAVAVDVAVAADDRGEQGAGEKKREPRAKMRFPTNEDLVAVAHEEFLWSEKADFGHVLHLEGGTLLSPTAWAGLVYAIQGFASLVSLGR